MVEGGTREPPKSETESLKQRWDYETRFKSYLYRIGVLGNEGVEAISNFPERIELNDRWHNRLNEIKKESYDGIERWLPVGMKQDRSLDFLPENSQKGFYTHVAPL